MNNTPQPRYERRDGNILMYSPYLYRIVDNEAESTYTSIGMFIEKEIADFVVEALNGRQSEPAK